MDRVPVKKFEQTATFELWDLEQLNGQERRAVEEAMAQYKKSTNFEFRAGAAAVAEDGTPVACHNETVTEEGTGQEGHAEMLALAALYRAVGPSGRKLKILALAASAPDEALIHIDKKYGNDVTLDEIEGERICGRCLKFISDYNGNFLSATTGKNESESDIVLLTVVATGQVLRTSLRSLHPMPHRPRRISLKPLERALPQAPDSYQTGK